MSGAAGAVDYARSKIGNPYEWGHEGPSSFDCSGLVWASYYYGAGYHWHRTTADVEITEGHAVTRSELEPGDLVQPFPGHIQLYVGDGRVIEAPKPGLDVREVDLYGFYRGTRLLAGAPAIGHHPYPGHYVMYGSEGPAVRLVQAKVGAAVDGIFGPHTLADVKHYQSTHHLAVDGIVGPLTWRSMFG